MNSEFATELLGVLSEALNIQDGLRGLNESSPLLGAIPELDSMAVVTVLAALEDHYGFVVDDDEINAQVFGTVGSLGNFVLSKLAA